MGAVSLSPQTASEMLHQVVIVRGSMRTECTSYRTVHVRADSLPGLWTDAGGRVRHSHCIAYARAVDNLVLTRGLQIHG